jgi:hypothetical protein
METAYRLNSSDQDHRAQSGARPSAVQQEPTTSETRSNYYRSIAVGVKRLAENTADRRLAMYDVARRAMITKLRALSPPLSETEITREQLPLRLQLDRSRPNPRAMFRMVPPDMSSLRFRVWCRGDWAL